MNKAYCIGALLIALSFSIPTWADSVCPNGEQQALIGCVDNFLSTKADLTDANSLRKGIIGQACSAEFTDYAVCSGLQNRLETELILGRIQAIKSLRSRATTPSTGTADASS